MLRHCLFLLRIAWSACASLASGMSLSWFAIVPGFLFPLGRGLEPLSPRPVFSARSPRAFLTKLDPGGVYGEFLGFPDLEFQAATSSGPVHGGILASSEVSSTTLAEMGRDDAPFWGDFVKNEISASESDISGFLDLACLPYGEKWREQNVFYAFSIFGTSSAWGACSWSLWRITLPVVHWVDTNILG